MMLEVGTYVKTTRRHFVTSYATGREWSIPAGRKLLVSGETYGANGQSGWVLDSLDGMTWSEVYLNDIHPKEGLGVEPCSLLEQLAETADDED